MITEKTMQVRCKAFSNEGVRLNTVRVSSAGVVTVWDSVAGYFTACHDLSDSAEKRILRLAGIRVPGMKNEIR